MPARNKAELHPDANGVILETPSDMEGKVTPVMALFGLALPEITKGLFVFPAFSCRSAASNSVVIGQHPHSSGDRTETEVPLCRRNTTIQTSKLWLLTMDCPVYFVREGIIAIIRPILCALY